MFDQQPSLSHHRSKRTSPPVWPLPSLDRNPCAIPRKTQGLDLAYERKHADDLLDLYPPNSSNGSGEHFMPNSVPCFVVADGVIAYAGKQANCYAVIVDHQNGWATYYTNLEHMFAMPTNRGARARAERVKAGDVLGFVGSALPGTMKCLHFELWKLGDDGHYENVAPLQHMRTWLVLPWSDGINPTDSAEFPAAA